ncbi:30S ribosomal protein S6 [Candidatus Daviesbacteria bacterium]|nr:30S ribosomal protein S6 [Candidatus Daviesbacteria bacterium]
MNNYYLTLVLKPDLEEKERTALVDGIVKKLISDQGKVEKEDLWGVRDLVYPIKRQTRGFYAHYELAADPKNARGLDKSLKLEEDILRHLLVRVKGKA